MKKFRPFPLYTDRGITIALILLMIFGTLMIASAEMGDAGGDVSVIAGVIIRQIVYLFIGSVFYVILTRLSPFIFSRHIYRVLIFVVAGVLIITRAFGSIGGAYAWLRFGAFTIQPSEFAKVFIILLEAKLLTQNFKSDEQALKVFKEVFFTMVIYAIIIVIWEKDTGSGIIFFGIAYLLMLIPKHPAFKKWQRLMFLVMVIGVILGILVLSPIGTATIDLLGIDDYRIDRFLSAADPFSDQYGSGYHLVMSLVAFATGGLFGVGYGASVHKYMNFPNPSSDFILPVIVEELGIIGLLLIVLLYGFIIYRLIKYSMSKYADIRARMVFLGVISYFLLHFILNVGGVSGLIPLTGVPLLLISSGGSSAMAAMISLGVAQNEIIRLRKLQKEGQ